MNPALDIIGLRKAFGGLIVTQDVSFSIDQRFALFSRDVLGQFLHVLPDEVLKFEHDLLTRQDRGLGPGLESGIGHRYCLIHLVLCGLGNPCDHFICSLKRIKTLELIL